MALYSGIIPFTAEKTILFAIISVGKPSNIFVKKAEGVAIITISTSSIEATKSVLTLTLSKSNSTDCK